MDNAAVLESSSISLADSQEAKKTSHHSDTSDISGDEGKDASKDNVIDPKHDAQEAEKCVTMSEAVKTSIDTNGNLKNDMQLADPCPSTMEVVHIVKETAECIKPNMQPPETFVVTKNSLTEKFRKLTVTILNMIHKHRKIVRLLQNQFIAPKKVMNIPRVIHKLVMVQLYQ